MTKNNKEFTSKEVMELIKEISLDIITTVNPIIGIPVKAISKSASIIDEYYRSEEERKDREVFIINAIRNHIISRFEMDEIEANRFINLSSTIINEELKEDFLDIKKNNECHKELLRIVCEKHPQMGSKSQNNLADIISFQVEFIIVEITEDQKLINDYFVSENNKRKNENEKNAQAINETRIKVEEIKKNCEEKVSLNQSDEKIRKEREYYSKKFTEPLYLHRENPKVNLEHLFVFPFAKRINSSKDSESVEKIIINMDNNPLVLLGDGGSGKSTVVSWLSWIYCEKKQPYYDKIFNNRELIVVRLREIDRELCQKKSLYESICKYLYLDKDNRNIFEGKYIVLDGFDELYLSSGIVDWTDKLKGLLEEEGIKYCDRLIITSRPTDKYYKLEGCNIFQINLYSREQKKAWIKNFNDAVGDENKIDYEIERYILKDGEVFFYPQLMYMVSGLKCTPDCKWSLDNKWSLYHQVFWEEAYRKRTDGNRYLVENNYREPLYNITKQIAYDMYKNGSETHFYNFNNELNELINKINRDNQNSTIINNIEGMVTFCCFFDCNKNGVVQFLHNNIRDYFIAEYIYDYLDEIVSRDDFIKQINENLEVEKELYGLLRSIPIEKEVLDFIHLRSEYEKEHKLNQDKESNKFSGIIDFVRKNTKCFKVTNGEIESISYSGTDSFFYNQIHSIFDKSFYRLDIYKDYPIKKGITKDGEILYDYDKNDNNVSNKIKLYLINLNNVFNQIVDTYEDRYVSLYLLNSNVYNSYSIYIKALLPSSDEYCNQSIIVFRNTLGIGNYRHKNLDSADFEKTYLGKAIFSGASLRLCIFNHSNFEGAVLRRTIIDASYFRQSILKKANFAHSKLRNVDFIGADLREAIFGFSGIAFSSFSYSRMNHVIFANSHIEDSKMENVTLRFASFCRANLEKVTFFEARLEKSDLREANFKSVIISNSYLDNADMRKMNLSNVKFDFVQLIDANLNSAVMGGARLYNVNLSNSNLSDAVLSCACFQESNLCNANLSGANLREASLEESNISGANFTNIRLSNNDTIEESKYLLLLANLIKNSINWEKAIYDLDDDNNTRIINKLTEIIRSNL